MVEHWSHKPGMKGSIPSLTTRFQCVGSVVVSAQLINRRGGTMFYYVYKIINLLNGKFYYGAHSTDNMDDGYMGSGTYLNRAFDKYGKENFTKEIIGFFESESDMFAYETIIITDSILNDDTCYNLASGGRGGSIRQNRKSFTGSHSEETKEKLRRKRSGKKHSEDSKLKMSENNWSKKDPEAQRKHASEAAHKSHENRDYSLVTREAQSETSKQQISDSLKEYFAVNGHHASGKAKKKIECPHCKKLIAINTAKRWHFDNCSKII
jgi:hypothetical protein